MASGTIDLEKLAQGWEPKLRDAFLQAVQGAVNRVNLSELARLIESGDLTGALRVVGLDPAHFSNMALVQAQMFNETGMSVAASLPAIPQAAGYALHILFNVRNPNAEAWVRNESGTLIQEITSDQLAGVRSWLEKGLQAGENPRQVALDLVGRIDPRTRRRTGGIVGLHSNQIAWLENYVGKIASDNPTELQDSLRYGLRDKRFDAVVLRAIKDGKPIPADTRAKMQLAYANRALKWRADSIARTETMKALGEAQTQAYQQAIDDGKLDQTLVTRFWVTAGDERVRPAHREIPGMNKDGVKWNQPFQTPHGPTMHAPFEINCRCNERVKVDFIGHAARQFKAEAV